MAGGCRSLERSRNEIKTFDKAKTLWNRTLGRREGG